MRAIDLHTHSNASDGSLKPSELMDLAREKGLSAIALTDHDTIDGIREAMERAKQIRREGYDLELIPGIELSSEYEGQDIHIVGLFIDIDSAFLQRRLSYFIESREKRNRRMCELLTEHGVPVDYEELKAEFPDSVLTRAHYGRFLLKKGYVKSVKEAFDRYIGDGRPCFIPRKKISPMRAVEIIRRAGGFPVFAHPVLCHMSASRLSTLVERLKNAGLLGIEALYGTYEPSDERDMRRLADRYGLVVSGGSDFHGKAKPGIDLGTGTGRLFIPESVLEKIKEAHREMLLTNDDYRLPKILFTDLDDTLLKTDKSISEYTFDVLKRFTDAGNFLVLNSGRDCNSIRMVYDMNGLEKLKNVYLVGYDGSEAIDCSDGSILFREPLPFSCVRYVDDKAREYGIHLHAYSDTHIFVHAQTPELTYYQRNVKTPTVFCDELADALPEEPCKCLAIVLDDKKRLEDFRDALTPWAEKNGVTLLFSSDKLLEIFSSKSGKGTAVTRLSRILSEKYALPVLCSIGAGDQQNDVSMLEAADISIAMCNGIDAVKEAASTVTGYDNDHDGLARELEDLF